MIRLKKYLKKKTKAIALFYFKKIFTDTSDRIFIYYDRLIPYYIFII